MDVTSEQQEKQTVGRRQRGCGTDIVATDGELLMRFTRHGDQRAFAQIVERHGGLVWIVCREVLGRSQDVEDAFQATFIILAERAATIRGSNSAAAWLCKVAQRTSLATRRKRQRLREESLTAEPQQPGEGAYALPDRELISVLFDELRRLPERYQTPLVLRYMEGQSRRAIAYQTDSTVAQIQGRLVRGRQMLRSRMLRRGVSLSLAAGAMSVAGAEASAAVTPALAAVTATGCLTLKTTGAVAGVSATALQLAKQGAKAMWLASMVKTAAMLSTAVTTVGIAWAVESSGALQPGGKKGGQDQIEVHGTADSQSRPRLAEQELAARDAREDAKKRAAQNAAATVQFQEKRQAELSKRMSEVMQSLDSTLNNKGKLLAKIELLQVDKSLVQQELKQTQEAKFRVETEPDGDRDADRRREKMVAKLEARMSEGRQRLEQLAQTSATMVADVERLESIAAQTRQLLSDLGRIELQSKYATAEFRTHEPAGARALPESGMVAEAPVVTRTLAPTATLSIATDANTISPGDAVRIQVLNALADQPIYDVYYVEPMGTVPLGPTYGRVNVSGLSILEAEDAVKKHLATIVENPQVQVTSAAKAQSPMATASVREYPAFSSNTFQPQNERLSVTADTNPNLDRELLQKVEAMAATIRELQSQVDMLNKQSRQKTDPQLPPR